MQAKVCVAVALLSVAMVGCGGDDGDSGSKQSSIAPLDPAEAHYGKTYAEWAVEWEKWIWQMPQKACPGVIPTQDNTGESCAVGQDESSPVFFLVGNFGGVTVRDSCVTSKAKAIFFPIINYNADNAGVAPADQLDADGLKTAAAGVFNVIKDLYASVDGTEIQNLESYKQGPTEYSYVVPQEPNTFSCLAMPGVEGEIKPAFVSGYWLMLPPLDAGGHDIHFKGRVAVDPEFSLDVTYHLKVE